MTATRFEPMPSSPLSMVVQHLRAASERAGGGSTDGELLTRFLSQRDDDALAALVVRHAPMVWGVCRRVLRNPHDAEDAFQATFLVLVRKAATVVPREMVGNWLYGVAQQTALRQGATAAKRGVREVQMKEMPEPVVAEAREDELLLLLDQELSRLPQQSRALIVLCDLEGKSRKDVARQLGCPEGTVASRLARARDMLAKRLARHGLAVSGGTLATAVSQTVASASVPPTVVSSTIKVATLFAAGKAAGVISGHVAALTEGMVRTMFLKKLMAATMMVLALGAAGITFGSLASGQAEGKKEGAERPMDKQPMAERKPMDIPVNPAPEKKASTPEEAMRVTEAAIEAGKFDPKATMIVEFKVRQVKVSVPVKSGVKDDSPWVVGRGPGDIALGPLPPADWRMKQFSAILTEKAVKQLNRDGINDLGKHFSDKTIRVKGRVERSHYVSSDPLAQPHFDLIVDDLSQLEVVK